MFNKISSTEEFNNLIMVTKMSFSRTGNQEMRGIPMNEHNRYNIITNGFWDVNYPVLVEVVASMNMAMEFAPNIIICKRQTAKKLVYWRTANIVSEFNEEVLGRSNFHLITRENVDSYINASVEKFRKEIDLLSIGNRTDMRINISDNRMLRECDCLKQAVTRDSYPRIVACSTIARLSLNGKMYYWPNYSLMNLHSAKALVYWRKGTKRFNKPQFRNLGEIYDGSVTYHSFAEGHPYYYKKRKRSPTLRNDIEFATTFEGRFATSEGRFVEEEPSDRPEVIGRAMR